MDIKTRFSIGDEVFVLVWADGGFSVEGPRVIDSIMIRMNSNKIQRGLFQEVIYRDKNGCAWTDDTTFSTFDEAEDVAKHANEVKSFL